MTEVAAPVWNEIAATQSLETPAAKIAFKLDQEQLTLMETLMISSLEERRVLPRVALCLPTFLPLLLENQAVSQFLSQHPQYRNALPEVDQAQTAVEIATQDRRLTPKERSLLRRTLLSPTSQQLWLEAATAAAQT